MDSTHVQASAATTAARRFATVSEVQLDGSLGPVVTVQMHDEHGNLVGVVVAPICPDTFGPDKGAVLLKRS